MYREYKPYTIGLILPVVLHREELESPKRFSVYKLVVLGSKYESIERTVSKAEYESSSKTLTES